MGLFGNKEVETTPGLYGAVGEFYDERDLVKAANIARQSGYTKLEAYSPFAVHGIDEALGHPPSKLGWLVFACGLTGAICALTFIRWAGSIDYPLTIGGKPDFAVEYSIPITFELTILLSAFAAVWGMFLLFNKLPKLYHPIFNYTNAEGISDDRFLLAIEAEDPKFDAQESVRFLESIGAKTVEVVED